MPAYLSRWAAAVLALLAGAVAFNYWVDPYGLYHPYAKGDWKPHAGSQGALVKPYLVLKRPPRTLLLGNSRTEVGLDPEDAAWPVADRPVFNLALPGTGTRVARRLFEHVLASHAPQTLVLGVDFMDFLIPADAIGGEPAITERLLVTPDGRPNHGRVLSVLHDGAMTLASLDAVLHSLDTLRQKGKTGVAHLTQDGFNPMFDYEQMAHREGYFNLFRQRDIENLRAYQARPRNLFHRGTNTSYAFDDVTAILDQARAHNVRVKVVIYPYHANLLETLRITGHWHRFERWKRELVRRVASHGGDQAVLWDFSGYHRYACEAVPPKGDRQTVVPSYWEAGHFKSELGHRMVERLFGHGDPGFGTVLTPDNVERHLLAVRQEGERYRQEHSRAVAELEELAR